TTLALFFAFVGIPFWIAGVIGLVLGKVDLSRVLEGRWDIILLWGTAPMGLYGLYTLWVLACQFFREVPTKSRNSRVIGILLGGLASIHMLSIGVGIGLVALPAASYFLFRIYQDCNT
ncbi:hypothetical protein, partial [Azotobacter salinestris]|uniref:hypothetical protein n=1 Tax=Azotobacter salinestris TaxID=69964 RepID=UPI0032DF0AED